MNEQNVVENENEEVKYPESCYKYRAGVAKVTREAGISPRELYRRVREAARSDGYEYADFDGYSTWDEKLTYLKVVATSEGVILDA